MSPNPTAQRSCVKEEEVDLHRSIGCSQYEDCLDAALRKSWRSWSCARCTRFAGAREQGACAAASVPRA